LKINLDLKYLSTVLAQEETQMITIRSAQDRGLADFGWLHSQHTFSFGQYQDPQHMGFGKLRVINEDQVAPGKGFATHGHQDMEIISYVLQGALEHKDSLGTGSVIVPGDVQRMTAGTGIRHSEFNASMTEPVHFLQIWILPGQDGIAPGYEQKNFTDDEKRGKLKLVGSEDGRDGSITIHQDVNFYAAVLPTGEAISYEPTPGRVAWIQVARGSAKLNNYDLNAGDGVAIDQELKIVIKSIASDTEVLLFDMAT
jgi:quercetin 2,3-dioxygenase